MDTSITQGYSKNHLIVGNDSQHYNNLSTSISIAFLSNLSTSTAAFSFYFFLFKVVSCQVSYLVRDKQGPIYE